MKRELRASLAFDGVERAEANGPPTAFRIWRAGDNVTDHGPTFFTDRSAALLMAQQAERRNRFSIDVNHLSLDKTAPLENQRAVGWFDIEVRDGELWAVNVEWTDTVRSGLSKDPPEWRYHSPAYDVDPETGEVLGLTNLAITNTPATHGVTALASRGAMTNRKSSRMKFEDVKAAFEGADPDAKAKAWAAIAKAMASGDSEEQKDTEEAPESKREAAEDEPEKKDAEDEPEKKDAEDEPEKKDTMTTKASVVGTLDAELRKANARIAKLESQNESTERATVMASVEMSPALAKVLAKKSLAEVKEICATLPPKAPKTKSTEHVQATRGEGQGAASSALPPDQRAALDERMGLRSVRATIRNEGTHQVIPTLTPDEIRAMRATSAKKEAV